MKKQILVLSIFISLVWLFSECKSSTPCYSFSESNTFAHRADWSIYFTITFNPDSSFSCTYQNDIRGSFHSEGEYRKCEDRIQLKHSSVYSRKPNYPAFPSGFILQNDTIWTEGGEFKKFFPFLERAE